MVLLQSNVLGIEINVMDVQMKNPIVRIFKVRENLEDQYPNVKVTAEVEGMTGRWLNEHFKTFAEIPNVDVFLCNMIASCVEYARLINSSELVFPPVDEWEHVENSSHMSSAGMNYGLLLALGADSSVREGIKNLMFDFNVEFIEDQPISDNYSLGCSIGSMFQLMRYDCDSSTADFCVGLPSIMEEAINRTDATGVNLRSLILENIMEKNPDMEFPTISFSYYKFF